MYGRDAHFDLDRVGVVVAAAAIDDRGRVGIARVVERVRLLVVAVLDLGGREAAATACSCAVRLLLVVVVVVVVLILLLVGLDEDADGRVFDRQRDRVLVNGGRLVIALPVRLLFGSLVGVCCCCCYRCCGGWSEGEHVAGYLIAIAELVVAVVEQAVGHDDVGRVEYGLRQLHIVRVTRVHGRVQRVPDLDAALERRRRVPELVALGVEATRAQRHAALLLLVQLVVLADVLLERLVLARRRHVVRIGYVGHGQIEVAVAASRRRHVVVARVVAQLQEEEANNSKRVCLKKRTAKTQRQTYTVEACVCVGWRSVGGGWCGGFRIVDRLAACGR